MTVSRFSLATLLLALYCMPLQAQHVLSSPGLKLSVAGDGSITGVAAGPKPWPLASPAQSGLLLRDVAAEGQFVAAGGSVTASGEGLKQAGTNAALKLDFAATYQARPGAIEVKGFIHDLSAQNRAITVRFSLPVDAAGGTWWQDLLKSETIADGNYANLHATNIGATGNSSAFPWGAISTAAGELCLGIPMDHFVVHRIAYDGQTRCFTLDFDFGLSPLTKAFPSRADFSFVLYTADPRWGMRSATAAYYKLFPDAFVRRAQKEGLWMPFTDISRVEDHEDFNFAFQEGAPNVAWDEAHGIDSFRYISPHWAMLWMPDRTERPTPEFIEQKLAGDLKSPDPKVRRAAEIIVNCAARNASGKYHYSIGQAHWAPHKTGYLGWYAMYPANADPDLAGGGGPTTGSEALAAVERAIATYNKPGAFLDGFYFDGVDERPLDNYATEHFASAEAPLTFGYKTHRPVLCGAFTSYKFLKRVAEKMWTTKRLTMANGVPSQFPFSLAYLDLAGSEKEPSIESEPVSREYLAYSRALMYHKPLVLLYKPRLEERVDRDLTPYLLDYMHACLPYAAEPSLFMIFSNTDPSFYYNFWERPDWYNRYRPIFVEYLPLVKRLALAGWEPVTHARATDPNIVVERFGTRDLHLVAYNPAREGEPATFDLDIEPGQLSNTINAVNLVEGTAIPASRRPDGSIRLRLTLAPRRSAVIAFAGNSQQLASFDFAEAVRYGDIAATRLEGKLKSNTALDFKLDPGDTGTPAGFAPYHEGEVSFSSDRQDCHSAPRCTKVTLTGQARAVQSAHLPVQAGTKYRFTLWGKTDAAEPSVSFYVRWKDKNGKDSGAVNSPTLQATTAWQQLQLEATAPKEATQAMFALVATHRGEGKGVVWFDDPSVVVLGADGQSTTLLPVPPAAPAPAAEKLSKDLTQRSEQLHKLAQSVSGKADAASLCSQALALATQLDGQARNIRGELPACSGVAAALEVSGSRLRRASGVLAGWQITLTGGGRVALGETPQFSVQVKGGAMPLAKVSVALTGDAETPAAPVSFALKAGETRTLAFSTAAPATVGATRRVVAVARAEIAGGQALTLERDASYTAVSPCETALSDQGQDESGRVRTLVVTARNTRREKPLAVTMAVAAPSGFIPSVITEQTVELKPGEVVKLPVTLTAAENAAPGWRETAISIRWPGGEQTHRYAGLFCPPTANLLKAAGFEGTPETVSKTWNITTKTGYSLDSKLAHWGQQAVRVSGAASSGALQRLELNQQVARPLVLRGWSRRELPPRKPEEVMTIGQTEQAPGPAVARRSPDYSLYVDLHYVGGGALYGQVATFDNEVDGWQFSEKIINVSRPIKDATVYLLYRGRPGTAWFDDIFLTETDPDLALAPGVSVTADSTFNGYTTAPLIDGVTDTEQVQWDQAAWASGDAKKEHWVEMTFPREVTIRTVLLYWAIDGGNVWTSRDYSLQVPEDGGWRELATVKGQTQRDMSIHSFKPVTTNRIRLLQPAGGGPATRPNILWLREIAVQ